MRSARLFNQFERQALKKISLSDKTYCVLFGILLSFIVLEFGLRIIGFGYNLFYKPPRDNGAAYRILCVGESTTWGVGASDPIKNGYPYQLQEMLNKRFERKRVQCLFDQTIGQNTSEILLKFPKYIKKYRPQLIILMVGINNWWNMDRSNIVLFSKKNSFASLFIHAFVFFDQFRVWKLFKYISYSLGIYKERWNYWCPQGSAWEELKEKDREHGHRIFEELAMYDIDEMIKLSKLCGAKVIICTYPMGSDRLVNIHMALAKKHGLPVVNNFAVFGSLPDLFDYLWQDYWHPNDRGYSLLAKNIYDCIVGNKIIE